MPSNNRKIIHLVYSFGFGGLEQVIVNLINNSSHYNAEHIIVSLTEDQQLHASVTNETQIYCLHKKAGKDISVHFKLFKLLKRLQADVIHTYNFSTIEYHFIAALAGVKNRVHCDHGRGGDDPKGLSFKNNLLRKVTANLIHHYIVVSPDLLRWTREVLKLNKEKVKIIFNGVNLKEYYPGEIISSKFTICNVGRADPVKNQKFLIDTFYFLTRKYDELHDSQLIIVGDGPVFDELKLQVENLEMQNQIQLLGYQKDIPKIMRQCDLFVLSSIYEAMPMTILEAMACGKPVISTNVGGVGYMMTDKEGWLVESNNKEQLAGTIFEVYQDKESRKKKALAGRDLVQSKYSIETMVKEYMSLYQCDNTQHRAIEN